MILNSNVTHESISMIHPLCNSWGLPQQGSILFAWTLSYLWVLGGRETDQTLLQITADHPFFSFSPPTGEEPAVGVRICLFILLNVSCSIKNTEPRSYTGTMKWRNLPTENLWTIYVYVFSPDKTPPTVHRTLSVVEREHKVKPFENKCVCETVRLPAAALARLPPCWLYCVQADGSPTAEPAHCFNMFWQGRLKHSSRHPSAAAMKGKGPSVSGKWTNAVVSVDFNRCCFSVCHLFFQKCNWQHSLVLN